MIWETKIAHDNHSLENFEPRCTVTTPWGRFNTMMYFICLMRKNSQFIYTQLHWHSEIYCLWCCLWLRMRWFFQMAKSKREEKNRRKKRKKKESHNFSFFSWCHGKARKGKGKHGHEYGFSSVALRKGEIKQRKRNRGDEGKLWIQNFFYSTESRGGEGKGDGEMGMKNKSYF